MAVEVQFISADGIHGAHCADGMGSAYATDYMIAIAGNGNMNDGRRFFVMLALIQRGMNIISIRNGNYNQ